MRGTETVVPPAGYDVGMDATELRNLQMPLKDRYVLSLKPRTSLSAPEGP